MNELTENQKRDIERVVRENPMRDVLKFSKGTRTDMPSNYKNPFTVSLPKPSAGEGMNVRFLDPSLPALLRIAADHIEKEGVEL